MYYLYYQNNSNEVDTIITTLQRREIRFRDWNTGNLNPAGSNTSNYIYVKHNYHNIFPDIFPDIEY